MENQDTIEIEFQDKNVKPFPETIQKILEKDISDEDIEVRPDGVLYMGEIRYRRRLNEAFKPGGWSIRILRQYRMDSVVCVHIALYAMGRFVSEATGDQDYSEKNNQMTYAVCLESAKSTALIRCCKDLGIGWQLWDKDFIQKWQKKNAVKVLCQNVADNNKGPKTKYLWRKKDADSIEQWPWIEIIKQPENSEDKTKQPIKEKPLEPDAEIKNAERKAESIKYFNGLILIANGSTSPIQRVNGLKEIEKDIQKHSAKLIEIGSYNTIRETLKEEILKAQKTGKKK